MGGIEGDAAVEARVEVALARADVDVEVAEPRKAVKKIGTPRSIIPTVEDERRIRPALVGHHPLDDRRPPTSSSESRAKRTFTGSSPADATAARPRRA